MSDQTKTLGDETLKNKLFIKGAWIDVKLYTLKATKRQQIFSIFKAEKDKKIIDDENEPPIPFYDELHYGNYE